MSIFPKDPENTEAADLQRKLEMLNNMMDQEARAEQARRQILYNIGHCKYTPSYSLSGCCFIRILFERERNDPINCYSTRPLVRAVACANFSHPCLFFAHATPYRAQEIFSEQRVFSVDFSMILFGLLIFSIVSYLDL